MLFGQTNRIEPTIDQQFASLADVEPGFAGAFIDARGSVIVLATENPEAVRDRFVDWLDAVPSRSPLHPSPVEVRPARYNYRQLYDWSQLVWSSESNSLIWMDVNERENVIDVGLRSEAERGLVLARVLAAGVDTGALRLAAGGSFVRTLDLKDKIRPFVPAGVRIEYASKKGCTLGINTYTSAFGLGFFTNSHCTPGFLALDGSTMYQNVSSDPANIVGVEYVDPPVFSCINPNGCRMSDAAWFRYDPSWLADFGTIARTTGFGSTTIDLWNPRIQVTGTGFFYQGSTVNMMGSTTGWRDGVVERTCYDFTHPAPGSPTLNCQGVASYFNDFGDSGAPVFTLEGSPTVTAQIVGIHHTRWTPDSLPGVVLGIFSEWNLMLMEFLGNLGSVDVN